MIIYLYFYMYKTPSSALPYRTLYGRNLVNAEIGLTLEYGYDAYIYMYVYIYIHVCIYLYIYIYKNTYIYRYTHIYIDKYLCVCIYIYICNICMKIHICVYIFTCLCVNETMSKSLPIPDGITYASLHVEIARVCQRVTIGVDALILAPT